MTERWAMARVLGGAACLLLVACQQEQAPVAVVDGDETQAEGEVLQGTISDRMIPYDEIGQGEPLPSLAPSPAPTSAPERRAPARAAARSAPAAAEPDPAPTADPEDAAAGEE